MIQDVGIEHWATYEQGHEVQTHPGALDNLAGLWHCSASRFASSPREVNSDPKATRLTALFPSQALTAPTEASAHSQSPNLLFKQLQDDDNDNDDV
ncbi:unnamed protein product [Lampetra planeri]